MEYSPVNTDYAAYMRNFRKKCMAGFPKIKKSNYCKCFAEALAATGQYYKVGDFNQLMQSALTVTIRSTTLNATIILHRQITKRGLF